MGTEQFLANNLLYQNILQLADNLSYFAGKHILTGGVNYERFNFTNGFNLQRYGYPFFGGLDIAKFYQVTDPKDPAFVDLNAIDAAVGKALIKQVDVNVAQLGLYAQDEYQLSQALKLTLGLRADVPIYNTTIAPNAQISAATFRDPSGNPAKVDVSELPKSTPLFSPRLGFNYTSQGDGAKTQVRGGTGIFTGRIPFVWISNQASNASFDNFYTYQINATGRDFRFPQVWRTNLAVDHELPGGIIGTIEAIYSKDRNAVVHRNYNLAAPSVQLAGADNRLIYPAEGRRFAYADDHLATTIGFFFEAGQGNRFSYTYAGDLNRDGIPGNDLIFVPASRDQIKLAPYTNAAGQVVSADQQYQQLAAYINQDDYLSTRRGVCAERNGAISPWYTQLDAKLMQDFSIKTSGGKRNTLQLSFDILNLGNLLNRGWGNRQFVGNNRLIETSYAANSDVPSFTFRGGNQTFFTSTDLASRWRAQVGVRYIFE